MLRQLDAKSTIDMQDVRLVALKNTEAATLAKTMQAMMDARLARLAATGGPTPRP